VARTVVHNNVEGSGLYQWARRPSRSLVAFTETILYDFFINDTGDKVECWKSIDSGATWASVASVTTDGFAITFDIFYRRWADAAADPIVDVVAHVDFSPRGIIYSSIELGPDTVSNEQVLKTWSAEPNGGHTSITIDEAGNLHAFGGGPAGITTYHFYSDDGGVTWTDTRSMSFTPTLDIRDLFVAWPDFAGDPGDVMVVHGDFSAGGSLYLHRYDHSADSWSNVTIDASFDFGEGNAISSCVGFAWRRTDGHLWVFGVTANDVSPATCKVWEITGATVTARTDLVAETYLRTTAGIMLSDDRLIGIYSYDPSDTGPVEATVHGVYYKVSEDDGVTWGTETAYSEFNDNAVNAILTDPFPAVDVGHIVYHDRNVGTDYIESPVIDLGDGPAPTIYRLMLAETDTPDVPELNITSHNTADDGETLVRFERGYSSAVLGEPPAAAQMSATLTGDYDLDEPVPGLAMQLNKKDSDGTWHHLCTVNLDIPAHAMTADHFRDEIQAVGYGRFAKLAGKTVSTELFEDITTGFAINELLDAAGFPADRRDIDAGEVRLPWWWVNNGDVMAELNKLRYSEGITSDLYEDGGGKIVFRSRSARFTEQRSVQAQASFTTSGDEPRLTGFEYFPGHREVINSATHTRNVRFAAGAPSIVWEDVDPPGGHYIVMPGLPITVLAEASEPFKDAITPVSGTDYSIVSFGSTITPTLERTSGQRTKITFTATGAGGAIINQLQLRATSVPLDQSVVETSTVDASDSIEAYGQRPWQGEMSAELEWTDMRDNLDVIVNWKKDPRARVRFGLGAYRGTEANDQTAQRDIGDRVRVVTSLRKHGVGAMTFDGDIWIQRIEHEVRAPASSSDGSLPADEFTWYEGIVISVAPGSSGSGVGGNNPYDEVDNGQSESPTTGLTDQGLLMRGIIGPLFGASDTPTITPPPGDPGAPPTPPVEGTTAGLVGFGRFNHDAYSGTFHMTSGTAGQIASMRAALLDGARVIIDSGTLVKVSSNIIMGENSQLLSPLDGSGASIQATGPCEIIDIGVPNVRVQNLEIHNYGDTDGDENQRCINIQGGNARDYWIDKCTFDHDQQNNGVAYGETINIFAFPTAADAAGDGTISRCYFLGKTSDGVETKALTIGAKHELDIDAAENTRVTIYQCVFEAWQRQAIQRKSAKVHYINCVYPEKNRIYGIGVTDGSHAVIEGCVFYGSTQANRWEVNANASGESVDNTARIYVPTSSGELRTGFNANGVNLLLNDAAVNDVNPTLAFNPASFYGYTVSAATEVLAAAIIAAAGRG
jgi:pectate lyase